MLRLCEVWTVRYVDLHVRFLSHWVEIPLSYHVTHRIVLTFQ